MMRTYEGETLESMLMELLESEAYARYYIEWDGKEIAQSPAFILVEPWSIGALEKKWTVYFSSIKRWKSESKAKAEDHIRAIFMTAKQSGRLWERRIGKKQGKLRLFARKELKTE